MSESPANEDTLPTCPQTSGGSGETCVRTPDDDGCLSASLGPTENAFEHCVSPSVAN